MRRRYEKPCEAGAESPASPRPREGERRSSHVKHGEDCRPGSHIIAEHAYRQGNSSSREWSVGTTATRNGNREMPVPPTLSVTDALQVAEANTVPLDDMIFDPTFFDIDPQAYYAEGSNSCGFIADVPLVANAAISGSNMDLRGLSDTADLSKYDHELAHLIRIYTENISPWFGSPCLIRLQWHRLTRGQDGSTRQ